MEKDCKLDNSKNTQNNRALKFFTLIDASENLYQCNICQKSLKGKSITNLVKHFKNGQSNHKNIFFKEIAIVDDEHILVQREKIVHSCVELVTINSHAFSLLSQSGFRNLIDSKLQQFQTAGCPLNLTNEHVYEIKNKVLETAKQIKALIRSETQRKIISIMLDSATRNGRSIYGISVQYMENSVIKVVPIAMRELKQSHTAVYLTNILLEILAEYNIELNQAISITTDNGSNMLAMVKEVEHILLEMQNTQLENQLFINEIEISHEEENIDDDIEQFLKESTTADDDNALDEVFDNMDIYEDLFEKLVSDLSCQKGNHSLLVTSIKCAAHTIQLMVKDALKLLPKEIQNIIDLCRVVAKFFRLQSTKNEMREEGLKSILPGLDVQTRWSSTYLMVKLNISSMNSGSLFLIRIGFYGMFSDS